MTDAPLSLPVDPLRWTRVQRLAAVLAGRTCARFVLQLVSPTAMGEPVVADGGDSSSQRAEIDSLFLTASLSKPIVAMGLLALVEAGEVTLQDRVQEFIPEFSAPPKRPITLRHLLTHTSGLPDMLPNNRQLRQSQAPLSRFVEGTCGVSLDFPCGRGSQYQSMGYALLGEIIARVSGSSCADYLRATIFDPLGMTDSALGAPEAWFTGTAPRVNRIATVQVPQDQQQGDDWNWNSRYWRSLGAPWGGVLSTSRDLCRFLQMMLNGGRSGEQRLFSPATVAAAVSNQLESFRDLPEADRRSRGWGLGWRLNWTGHAATFSDLLPPAAYGHWGATGTLWWVDPIRRVGLVLLSTLPLERDRFELLRLSNAVAAAIVD